MRHIFVIDDEADIRALIVKYLEKEGFKTTTFMNGNDVAMEVERLQPDLLVMDIMMPGMDGLEVCKEIRKVSDVPIIFVSARGEEIDRIIGLELGADDYLSKPFSPRELIVRIKNIFRRLERSDITKKVSELSVRDVQIHLDRRSVSISGSTIGLTGKEFDTLKVLFENVNVPLTREQILEKVWGGYDYFGEIRIVDDVIKRVRKKLKEHNSHLEIITVWGGFGYKIEDDNKS